MLETSKTRQPKPDVASIEAPLISPVELVPATEVPLISPVPDADPIVPAAAPMFIPALSRSGSPAYSLSEGIVVSATSMSGSPSYPPPESFESLSTSRRIVISATSLSGSPSYPPPEPFESQSTSRRIRSPSGSPSYSPSMPMKLSANGPNLSGRIRTSSPPSGVGVYQVFHMSTPDKVHSRKPMFRVLPNAVALVHQQVVMWCMRSSALQSLR
jgi:hypothetical protein